MKLLHLADLHLGKFLHNKSLIEGGDQPDLIGLILTLAEREKPDAVLIAGDVYDRGIPAKEAVPLLSCLLTGLARELGIPVLLVAGNHDGGERLGFASELLSDANVYIAGLVEKELSHVTLTDEYGPVDLWLMPYIFPAAVRNALGASIEEISDYETAAARLLAAQKIDTTRRNVLIAHQYVVDGKSEPIRSDSESMCGGSGAIDYTVFDAFDYVALGHIHGAQCIGRESIRYAGAPLCYHFSEVGQEKGALLVTLGAKGTDPSCRLEKFTNLHNVRSNTGRFADVLAREKANPLRNEYVSITLTDVLPVRDAGAQLSAVLGGKGSLLLDLNFRPEYQRSHDTNTIVSADEERSMDQLFEDFYTEQRGGCMTEAQLALIRFASERILSGVELGKGELSGLLAKMALEQEEIV